VRDILVLWFLVGEMIIVYCLLFIVCYVLFFISLFVFQFMLLAIICCWDISKEKEKKRKKRKEKRVCNKTDNHLFK